jgi:hypothetical protein
MVNIWIDTEFTELNRSRAQLCSIGCVDEDNRTFYAVLNDYDPANTSRWVKKHVLPVIDQGCPYHGNHKEIGFILGLWLPECPINVFANYSLDIDFMKQLLVGVDTSNISYHLCGLYSEEVAQQYLVDAGLPEHHALYDAKAYKYAWYN